MNGTFAIYKKELNSYFNSPMAYIVVVVFLLIAGWLFFNQFFLTNQASMRTFFNLVPLFFVFFTPAIAMRLISEEKKSGTIELILTMPVNNSAIIVGKFLAGTSVIFSAVLMTLFYVFTVSSLGNLDMGPIWGGYIGLFLMGSSYMAIGLLASALTKNQIIAFIIGFSISFVLFMFDKILPFIPSFAASFFEYISIDYHFRNIAKGIIDSRDIIYYLSLIGISLLLASNALESDKWK